jgi:serine/threonine-protein kinase
MSLDDALEWSLGGRYTLHGEIAAGGMATVHIGRQRGTAGFSKMVAIKRLHAQYAKDPDFVSMFLDEARLAARVHHPNVVSTLDVIATDGEVFLVMEYIRGESLSRLLRSLVPRGERMSIKVAAAIMVGVLHGLHAAHEATNEKGEKLDIVHRDVSPQNILVGTDGTARVLDFGIAKAETRSYQTRDGDLKGKLAYMAPEQLTGESIIDRRTDIFAASIVLWEVLTGQRLFDSDYQSAVLARIKSQNVDPPSKFNPDLPKGIDELVLKGLARDPTQRFATAREMAIQLEMVMPLATPSKVGEWVEEKAAENLAARSARIAEIERGLAPDVVQESKGILDELRLDSKSQHTAVERGARSSVVDGREAGRTPVSKPGSSRRASAPDSSPSSRALPLPPTDREKNAAHVSSPPLEEIVKPSTKQPSPKIVDLPQDELMTSPSAVMSPDHIAKLRAELHAKNTAPPPRQKTIPPELPIRKSIPPELPQSRKSIPPELPVRPTTRGISDPIPSPRAPSINDALPSSQRRISSPGLYDESPRSNRPAPTPPPPRSIQPTIRGGVIEHDIPIVPPALGAPSVAQFALPEIPPMAPPVDLTGNTDYSGKPRPRKFNWAGIFVFLGLGAVGAYLLAPTVVDRVYTQAALNRGISLKIDHASVEPNMIRIFGVAATSADLPGVYVHANEIDFNIRDHNPPTMTMIGVDATIDGPYAAQRDALNRYLTSHPMREGNSSSTDTLQTIVVQNGHVTWGRLAGDNSKLDFQDVSGKVEVQPGHALGDDFAFTSSHFEVTSPFGTVGPWSANLAVGPFATRIDVALTPASPAAASIHYSDQANAGVQIDGKIARTTIDALGIPRAIVGLAVDESMQVEGTIHYSRPTPTNVEGNVVVGLYGTKLRGALAPVDIRFQAGIAGDPTDALPIINSAILFGGMRGEIWGKAQFGRDAFHIDASWRTAPRYCGSVMTVDPSLTLAQVAQDPAALDRAVNSVAGGGQTYVAGAFVLDSRDLAQATVNATPSNKCGLKIFP